MVYLDLVDGFLERLRDVSLGTVDTPLVQVWVMADVVTDAILLYSVKWKRVPGAQFTD